jgi:streptogramin lyase
MRTPSRIGHVSVGLRAIAFACLFGLGYLAVGTAGAASPVVTTYPIPTHSSGAFFLATGPDNSVWFTEIDANKVGKIAKDGTISEFPLPHPSSQPARIIQGSDGAMWFVEYAGDRIGRITTAGALTEYAIPTAAAGPYGLANGAGGAIWFTEQHAHGIGEITQTGSVRDFQLPSEGSDHCAIAPAGIARDADRGFWAVDSASQHFWRIAPDGRMLDFTPQWPESVLSSIRSEAPSSCASAAASSTASPPDIFADADLLNRAFVIVPTAKPDEFAISMSGVGSYAIGNPAKRLQRVQVGWGGPVTDIAANAGTIAFTDIAGQVTWTTGRKTSVYNVLVHAKPAGIALAPDGSLWVCASGFNAIMHIRP